MIGVYYVDTAIPSDRKKRGRVRLIRSSTGGKVFKVRRLTELEGADEIYINSLLPELYDEILESLRRGVRVYLLKDVRKLMRMENNLKKNDENNAMLFSRIPREAFRLLTIEEIELKAETHPLINKYEWLVRWRKQLRKLVKDGYDYNFKESIRLMEMDRRKISEEIIRQVDSLPIYGEIWWKACEILGAQEER